MAQWSGNSVCGFYDAKPDTITEKWTERVTAGAWLPGFQPVENQILRLTCEKSYWENSSPDDIEGAEVEVVKVEWLANNPRTDIPWWIDVTDLLKTQCDLRDLLP